MLQTSSSPSEHTDTSSSSFNALMTRLATVPAHEQQALEEQAAEIALLCERNNLACEVDGDALATMAVPEHGPATLFSLTAYVFEVNEAYRASQRLMHSLLLPGESLTPTPPLNEETLTEKQQKAVEVSLMKRRSQGPLLPSFVTHKRTAGRMLTPPARDHEVDDAASTLSETVTEEDCRAILQARVFSRCHTRQAHLPYALILQPRPGRS